MQSSVNNNIDDSDGNNTDYELSSSLAEETKKPLMMDYDSSSARQDGFGIGGGPIGSVTNFFASFILSQVFGLFIIVFVSVWISRYLGGISFADSLLIFNFHPLFMTLGMVFIFGDAILVYRVMRNERKKILKILHAVLHGLALGLALLGSWSVWYYHSSKGIPNLYSLHSWLGLLTMGLFTSQYALGFVSFLFPGLAPGYRRIVLPYHVYIGVTLFVLAAVTSLLGITEKAFFSLDGKVNPRYADKPGAAYVINMLGLSIVIFVAIVVYLVTNNQYRRRPLPEEQALQLQNEETTSMN